MEDNNKIWKDYGNYLISNKGDIKNKKTGKILKQIKRKDGYLFVNLSNKGKVKVIKVHKLVAHLFLKNPNNYPCINHINGIKTDNRVVNLEFCSYSHNIKEAYRLGLKKPIKIIGSNNVRSKKVNQYNLIGEYIKTWDCIKDASRELNIKDSNISLCCKGKRNKAGGYMWKYEEFNK